MDEVTNPVYTIVCGVAWEGGVSEGVGRGGCCGADVESSLGVRIAETDEVFGSCEG